MPPIDAPATRRRCRHLVGVVETADTSSSRDWNSNATSIAHNQNKISWRILSRNVKATKQIISDVKKVLLSNLVGSSAPALRSIRPQARQKENSNET